jgi:hypothetical protein
MNRFQPCVTKMPKLPKFPKNPCSSKNKVHEYKSSSSSDDGREQHLRRLSRQKHLIEYISSESDDSCDEQQHSKYDKQKNMIHQNYGKKKPNQQFHLSDCDLKDVHKNEIQSCDIKDCCYLLRNECAQCAYPQCTIKNCCNSRNNYCASCCPDCSSDIGSTINHYRSNNLLMNSRFEPRRYPVSWTPLQGRSCSPTDRIVKNVCTNQECNDPNGCNDESYEGDCNVICGGVAQRNTPSCTHTNEVSSYSLNKCSNLGCFSINK